MNNPQETTMTASDARLDRIEATLQQVLVELRGMSSRQRRIDELVDELIPIGREAMRVGGLKLQALDERGWTALATALARGLDSVVGAYGPEDFEALADNLVAMTDVVRGLTQPEVLAIADEAAQALQDAGSVKPVSLIGAFRAGQEDEVQKGIAVLLQVVRQVGRITSSRQARGGGKRARRGPSQAMDPRLVARLAPTRRPSTEAAGDTNKAAAAPSSPAATAQPDPNAGLLAPKGEWTREFAETAATAAGIELTPVAWTLIEFSREAWERTGSSPNIRALAKGMGVDTRAVYQSFPTAPGRTIARIAGIPKPHGCI